MPKTLYLWDLGRRAIHAVAAIKELSVGVFISPKRDLDEGPRPRFSLPDKPKICGTAGCKHMQTYIFTGIIAILIYFLSIFPDFLYWFFFVFHPSSGCDMEKMTWKFNPFSIEFYHNSHKQSGPSREWAWNARVVNPHESWVSDCTKKRLALKAICGHKHTSGVNIETIEHDSTSCETRWHAWNTYMETSSNDWRRGLAPCPSTLHVSSLPAMWPCL